ncbi:MAG TPA: hypothetical protein VGD78_21920 [Chthoniobacterales bacterium]
MMKIATLVCLLAVVTFRPGAVAGPPAQARNITEYSLAMGEPYPSEVDLAYRRLWKFLQRPNGRGRTSLEQTPFVAVQVGAYDAAEVPAAMGRIERGTAQANRFYGSDRFEPANAPLQFLIVFDSRSRRPVGPTGFFVSDTPNLGGIGKFGGIVAVYAGTR